MAVTEARNGTARWSRFVPLCAIFTLLIGGEACLNPIPDDFPNGNDRHVDVEVEGSADTPQPAHPGNAGGGVSPGAPSGTGSGGTGQLPAEPEDGDGDSPPASAAPDAGAGPVDAGGTGGGG